MSFITELKRRNVVKVASVYLMTAWLILQVIAVVSPYLNLPKVYGTYVTVALIIGFPVVCVFAWAFELTPEGIKATSEVSKDESIAKQTGHKINHVLMALIIVLVVYVAVDKLWLSASPIVVETAKAVDVEEEKSVKTDSSGPIFHTKMGLVRYVTTVAMELMTFGVVGEKSGLPVG